MAEDAASEENGEDTPKKKKGMMLPLLIGLVLAIAGGTGGFFAVSSGMIGGGDTDTHADTAPAEAPLPTGPAVAFIPLDPLLITLGQDAAHDTLRFTAQLEVPSAHQDAVRAVLPRIVDVLNGYLRAVDIAELEDPAAMIRLRAQMLRRIQLVSGEGQVRDLLIMEFLLT